MSARLMLPSEGPPVVVATSPLNLKQVIRLYNPWVDYRDPHVKSHIANLGIEPVLARRLLLPIG